MALLKVSVKYERETNIVTITLPTANVIKAKIEKKDFGAGSAFAGLATIVSSTGCGSTG